MPVTALSYFYLFLPLSVIGVSKFLSVNLINLLEQLTELRASLFHQFSIKDITKDAVEEMGRMKYGERDMKLLCPLQVPHPPTLPYDQLFGSSLNSYPCPFGISWRLHCISNANRPDRENPERSISSDSS
jgi:hypothetical protein